MNTNSPRSGEIRTPTSERPGDGTFPGQTLLGTLAILYATGIIFLAMADDTLAGRFMPRTWYTNRALWYCSAVAGYVAGFYLLRPAPRAPSGWAPSRPGVRFSQAVLYTREGCHLCNEMRDVLDRYSAWLPPIEAVDIDTSPDLVERFGTTIPVLELDGRVRFNGRLNEMLLRRLIEGTAPIGERREGRTRGRV